MTWQHRSLAAARLRCLGRCAQSRFEKSISASLRYCCRSGSVRARARTLAVTNWFPSAGVRLWQCTAGPAQRRRLTGRDGRGSGGGGAPPRRTAGRVWRPRPPRRDRPPRSGRRGSRCRAAPKPVLIVSWCKSEPLSLREAAAAPINRDEITSILGASAEPHHPVSLAGTSNMDSGTR